MRRCRARELLSLKGYRWVSTGRVVGYRVFTNLGASLAVVGLLAGMNTLMHGQGRSLDELLATFGPVTDVWSDTAVNTLCFMSVAVHTREENIDIPWRARSLRRAKPFPQVLQG